MSLLNTDQISSALPVTPYKNKSTITLYLISDDTQGEANQFFNSLDDIKNAFKINFIQKLILDFLYSVKDITQKIILFLL